MKIGKCILAFLVLVGCASAQLTYTDFTGLRSASVVYQNTSTHPVFLLMTENNSSAGTPSATEAKLFVDSANPPVQQVDRNSMTQHFAFAGNGDATSAIVPAGWYYELTYAFNNPPIDTFRASETSIDVATTSTQTTPVRALTTIYHNTTTDPIWVQVVVLSGVSAGTVSILSDSSATPTTVIGDATSDAAHYMAVKTWVLPGNYYQVTGTNVSIDTWVETSVPGLSLTQVDETASRCEDSFNYTVCNYVAGTPLFAAMTSDMGSFSNAGTHFSGLGSSLSVIGDVTAVTRNAGQHSENVIAVQRGFSYGDRNDNGGSTLGHWIEWFVNNPPTIFPGEQKRWQRRRIIN